MNSLTRSIMCLAISITFTTIAYLEDKFANESKKRSRYTRLAVMTFGVSWFLLPFFLDFTGNMNYSQGGGQMMQRPMMGSSPMMHQRFDVGPSPF